jgi:hypothetical protein
MCISCNYNRVETQNRGIDMVERVQIPAYTDRWMMGDRYGEVVKVDEIASANTGKTIIRVKLDKSGKTVKVVSDDCTPV